jgi:hypothetical protein
VWRIGKSKFGLDMLLADTVLCINGNLTMYETSDVSHTFSGAVSIDQNRSFNSERIDTFV